MKVKKIAYAGLFIAMGILLPQLFHLSGLPQSGSIFLPMHIPVLFAGFILGPLYGALIGVLLPIISAILTGMPPAARLPFMICTTYFLTFFSELIPPTGIDTKFEIPLGDAIFSLLHRNSTLGYM